jgi:gliding motility-associated-like protein
LASTITPTNVNCNGASTGAGLVSATGGTSPYNYSLNNGTAVPDSNFTALAAGNYNVLITDANGCTSSNNFSVTENPAISGSTTSTNANCNQNNGTATVSGVSGGVGPYTYSWTPGGGTTSTITGLSAGGYTVTITDNVGCTYTASATVSTTVLLTASITSQINNLCFGQNLGSATVVAASGTGPYSYLWSPSGGNGSTASALTAGTYTCTVTDQDNCSATATVSITEPSQLIASMSVSPAACTGTANATASVSVNGGTSGYTYVWSDGSTNSTTSGLSAGPVSVNVTDANGCTTSANGNVDPNSNITATVNVTDASCNAFVDGAASVSAPAGAYPPFSYLWSTSATSNAISNLASGNYFVTITDAKGCTIQLQATVSEPAPLSVFAGSDSSVCVNTLQLYASNIYSGQWSAASSSITFVNPSDPTTVVNGLSQGINTLMWTVSSGVCSDSATIDITLQGDLECEFDLPSGFTPNGDGFNDGYVVHGLALYPDNVFRVFNRWGNEVYYREDYQNAEWYGQNNSGDLLPEGTYFVIFEVVGKDIQKSTYVDLRRGQK